MSDKTFKLPEAVLDEYNIYKGFIESDPLGTYQTFLKATDYKIIKLYENIVKDFAHASEIIDNFKMEEAELLNYRQIAREEAGPLQDALMEEFAKLDEENRKREEQENSELESSKE